MRSRKEKLDILEKRLVSSWKTGEAVSVGSGWQADIMREIRLSGIPGGKMDIFEDQGRLIWRFSMVAAGFTLFFLLYALTNDIMPYRDLALLFLDDPAGFILSPPFV
ncbi:MAG: hypothetical protein JW746_09135 [Candidatus Krumholzibacteriota bacterium]|nr:hypothetical protein [Candidatus Krumholzibacteriota bacterium]